MEKEKADWKKVVYPPAIWFTEELRSLMLKFARLISGLLIIVLAYLFLLIVSKFFGWGILPELSFVAVVLTIFFIFLYWGRPMMAKMKLWNEAFTRFLYAFRFETYPLRGATPQEKIFNQLQSVFSEGLGGYISIYQKDRFFSLEDFLNVKVSGKKTEHVFDVYISDEILKNKKGKWAKKLKSKLRKHGSIFVKRFDKKVPVDNKELEKLRGEIYDVINKTKARVYATVVVSTSDFTESAKKYVRNKKNWIKKHSFDLVQERPDGYIATWVSP